MGPFSLSSSSYFDVHFLLTVGLQGEYVLTPEWGTELQTRPCSFLWAQVQYCQYPNTTWVCSLRRRTTARYVEKICVPKLSTLVGWISVVSCLRPIFLLHHLSSVPIRLYGRKWWADLPFPWPVRGKHGSTRPVVLHQRICERYGTWQQGTGTNLSLFWLASRYLSWAFLFLFGFSPLLHFPLLFC